MGKEEKNFIIMQYEECMYITPRGEFLFSVDNGRAKKISAKKARAIIVKRESTLYWNRTKDELKKLLASK